MNQSRNKSLSEFSPVNWEDLIAELKRLEVSLRHKDARRLLIPELFKGLPVFQENIPSENLSSDVLESNIEASQTYCPINFDEIIVMLQVQQALSYIRPILVKDLNEATSLKQSSLFSEFISKLSGDNNKNIELTSLFEDIESSTLKSREEIESILSSNDLYSLEILQQKFREFIHRWHNQNLPLPIFVQLDYKKITTKSHSFDAVSSDDAETLSFSSGVSRASGINNIDSRNEEKNILSDAKTITSTHCSEEESEYQDAISSLKNSTSQLSAAVGEDPLREIIEEMNPEKETTIQADPERPNHLQGNTPEIYKLKRSAVAMEFSDSDEESQEIIKKIPVEKPAHKKIAKRRRFTQEEKDAIKEGVMKYGLGKWAKIKFENIEVLQNRTNVNIKDCYRTMMRKGEF